jgi:hypothetical protein
MHSPRTLAVATFTAATIALSAGPTLAAPPGHIQSFPVPVAPGRTVTLTTHDCGKKATAVVNVFGLAGKGHRIRLTPKPHTNTRFLRGSFRISKKAKKGPHGIVGRCSNGKRLTGVIFVSRHR